MKRDEKNNQLDRQIAGITDSLREEGTAPNRDLWPEIEEAIGKTEQEKVAKRRSTGYTAWRVVSLAASLVLILGLGYIGSTGRKSLETYQADTGQDLEVAYAPGIEDASSNPSTLQRLDRTLRDLNDALHQDPDNRNLSRLVLLVHKSRANVLRQNTQNLAR